MFELVKGLPMVQNTMGIGQATRLGLAPLMGLPWHYPGSLRVKQFQKSLE